MSVKNSKSVCAEIPTLIFSSSLWPQRWESPTVSAHAEIGAEWRRIAEACGTARLGSAHSFRSTGGYCNSRIVPMSPPTMWSANVVFGSPSISAKAVISCLRQSGAHRLVQH